MLHGFTRRMAWLNRAVPHHVYMYTALCRPWLEPPESHLKVNGPHHAYTNAWPCARAHTATRLAPRAATRPPSRAMAVHRAMRCKRAPHLARSDAPVVEHRLGNPRRCRKVFWAATRMDARPKPSAACVNLRALRAGGDSTYSNDSRGRGPNHDTQPEAREEDLTWPLPSWSRRTFSQPVATIRNPERAQSTKRAAVLECSPAASC